MNETSKWIENPNNDPELGDWCYRVGSHEVSITNHLLLCAISGYGVVFDKHLCPYKNFPSEEAQEILGEMHELFSWHI